MDNSQRKPFEPNAISLLAILMASMVIIMGAAAVAPALKPIAEHFGIEGGFTIALVVSLPSLSVAITGFGVGYLADRIGKAKVFILALAIFTIAGTGAFLLDDFTLILITRFILGIGISGISLTTTALISEYYTGMQRGKVIGYQAAAIGIGALVLESAGGSLADIGWNYPFLIYLIGLPIIVLGLLSVREPSKQPACCDASKPAEADDAPNGRMIGFCYAMIFMAMLLMFTLPMNFSYYISEMGASYAMVGILLGVLGASQGVFSILYSRRAVKPADGDAYMISFVMIGLGLCLLFFGSIALATVSMILIGSALGLLTPTVISRLSMMSTAKTSGKIMGGYSVFMNLASFVSTLIFAPVLAIAGGYCETYLIMGIVGFLTAAIAFAVGRREKHGVEPIPQTTATVHEIVDGSPSMYRRILVATDGSRSSDFAVNAAVNIAKKNNAELTVLFVMDPDSVSSIAGPSGTTDDLKTMAVKASEESFASAKRQCEETGVHAETVILNGHPAEVIARESSDYDLCICGSLGKTEAERMMLGSVAEKVVRTAACPVLVCRSRRRWHRPSVRSDE